MSNLFSLKADVVSEIASKGFFFKVSLLYLFISPPSLISMLDSNDGLRSRLSRNQRGFTFIELVVVIVIMSVLISVGSPYLSNFYKSIKIESSARQLRIFLDHAREVALSEKRTCRVKVGADWRKLSLYMQKDPEGKQDEYIRVEGSVSAYNMMEGINIDEIKKNGEAVSRGSETDIDIYPLFAKQEVSFTMKDLSDNKAKVRIEAGSGKVVIE